MSEQDKNNVSFGDPATEPVDLAQAFKMLNQADREAAEAPVDDEQQNETPSGDGGSDEAGDGGQADQQLDATAAVGEHEADGAGVGGSADFVQAIDFDARRQEILRDIQQQALELVRQDFANQQINTCSIEDLYQRDEQTGRVTFKNPDDPTRDFTSRAEAQQWVDAFNKQVQLRFRQEVNNKQQELVSANAPTLRLISFIPKYEAMSQIEKDVLDDLIEAHGVRNGSGDVIGYNCDLDAMAAQAKKIAKRIQPQATQTVDDAEGSGEAQKQATEPAMDMPTGTGKAVDQKEPKSIGEALKMYDKQLREKGKRQ